MSRFIETLSPMKGGTQLPYGGALYHFTPNELGHFVAEVADDQHYDAILSIGAGYRPYPAQDALAASATLAARLAADAAVQTAANTRVGTSAVGGVGGGGGGSGDGETMTIVNCLPVDPTAARMAKMRAAKAAKAKA